MDLATITKDIFDWKLHFLERWFSQEAVSDETQRSEDNLVTLFLDWHFGCYNGNYFILLKQHGQICVAVDPCGKYEICNEACNPNGYECGMYYC